jgi:peptidoglycan/LPS O-acetylase OafA/YrhL
MWSLTILTITAPLYVSFIYIIVGKSIVLNAIFLGFIRNIWGVSICWIIFACHFGFGGLVNKFLSSKFWMPIGKLGLSIYLVHPVLQYNFVASRESQLNLETSALVRIENYQIYRYLNILFFS